MASLLAGRDPDLAELVAAWDRATGGTPQLVTVLAETGIGKTRLVQAFYEWLNVHQDPEHYWPDTLGHDGNSLRVNPIFDTEGIPDAEIPWLWLALRFVDPGGRNVAPGWQLSQSLAELRPHVRPLLRAELRRELGIDVALEVAGTVANALTMNLPGAVISIWNLLRHLQDERRQTAASERNVAAEVAEQRRDLAAQLRAFLAATLDPGVRGMHHVPVVLFLDDAHWADVYSLEFVDALFRDAQAKRWPLLVICTHWEREWHEQQARATVGPQAPGSLAELVARNPGLSASWKPRVLGGLGAPALAEIARSMLPGLGEGQLAAIAGWVGGNPQLLEDLLQVLRGNARWFVDHDVTRALSAEGERRFERLLTRTSHHALVQQRFDMLPESLRDVLSVASTQGMRFVAALAAEAARRTEGMEPASVLSLLQTAHRPLAIIEPASRDAREFRHRAVFEIARGRFADSHDEQQQLVFEGHVRDILAEWLTADAPGELEPVAEEQLLRLAHAQFAGDGPDGGPDRLPARLRAELRLLDVYERRALYGASAAMAESVIATLGEIVRHGIELHAELPLARLLLQGGTVLIRSGRYSAAQAYAALLERNDEALFARGVSRLTCRGLVYHLCAVAATGLQQPDRALESLDAQSRSLDALRRAVEEAGRWSSGLHDDFERQRALIAMSRAGQLVQSNRVAEAWHEQGAAIRILESLRARLAPLGSWTDADDLLLGAAYYTRVSLRLERGDSIRVLAELDNVIATLAGTDEPSRDQVVFLAANRVCRAGLRRYVGDPQGAIDDCTAAIECLEGLAAEVGPVADWNPAALAILACAHSDRGLLHRERNACRDAQADHDSAIAGLEALRAKLAGRGNWLPAYSQRLCEEYARRGRTRFELGDADGAIDDNRKALELIDQASRGSAADSGGRIVLRRLHAHTHAGLSVACRALGRDAECSAHAGEEVSTLLELKSLLVPQGKWSAQDEHNLAVAYIHRSAAPARLPVNAVPAITDTTLAIRLLETVVQAQDHPALVLRACRRSLEDALRMLSEWQALAGDAAGSASSAARADEFRDA